MDSSSRDSVLKLFQQIIEWKSSELERRATGYDKFNWTSFHLSAVYDYVLKLRLDFSDFRVQSLVKFFEDEFWYHMPRSSRSDAIFVASFAQELEQFFVVPKQHQLFESDDVVEQNELVAAFINLLLQLLCHKTGSFYAVEDGIDHLEKELRFLLIVVGDMMLIRDEHEQLQNLSAEIEAVVNEAGSFVHSVVFSTFADPILRLGMLLKHMDSFKANVVKFSNQQPVIAENNTTPKRAAESSLFIIDSLRYDLEDLLDQEMIVDVKDQINLFLLRDELKFLQSCIKDIKASRYSEAEELKEPVMRIRDAAYEAEYLINSLLIGDAPSWYFSIRLSHVLNKIKLINTGIQGIKENYEIGASKVAKNFTAQLSLQKKRSSKVDDIIVGFEEKATYILDQLEGGDKH